MLAGLTIKFNWIKIMKKIIAVLAFMAISSSIFAKTKGDSLGLPGDNLDLYAVLDLFKQSENPETFEKAINDPANGINNLDLNNDGEIDYIKVFDKGQGDAHAFVLQVPINEHESQDVAVVEVEKSGTDAAHVQIIGDEDLYGKDYIVEPVPEKSSSSSSAAARPVRHTVIVNVWHWRPVRYIYGPHYIFWTSPWRWGLYPAYWKPWHPVQWSLYYKKAHHFHYPYYKRTVVYHVNTAHKVYYKQRITSETYHRERSAYLAQQANKPKQKSPSHIKGHTDKKTKKTEQK